MASALTTPPLFFMRSNIICHHSHHPHSFARCREIPLKITVVSRRSESKKGRRAFFSLAEFHDDCDYEPQSTVDENTVLEAAKQGIDLRNRVNFGLGIGLFACVAILAGGCSFQSVLAAAIFVGSKEYFELVRKHDIASGMTPLPRNVAVFCSATCTLMPFLALYTDWVNILLAFSTFVATVMILLQRGACRFSHLTSAFFGLIYCGYLPSFWVMLRSGFADPSSSSGLAAAWPGLLGGKVYQTVGLTACLMTFGSIIAADTCAYFGGKAFGRTQLTSISPKKTWEGTIAGLMGSLTVVILLARIFNWPASLPRTIAFGVLTFIGSLFGDLAESVIKRDVGVKDSCSLIPGHGGLLDRADSYIFTGALVYAFIKAFSSFGIRF